MKHMSLIDKHNDIYARNQRAIRREEMRLNAITWCWLTVAVIDGIAILLAAGSMILDK